MPGSVLAVDIGGTKFAAALVDSGGGVHRARRVATPQGGDAHTLWKTLTGLIDSVLDDSGADGSPPGGSGSDSRAGSGAGAFRVEGVGVGCGGPMIWPDGVVSPLNMPGWRGFPLRARLAERFPGVPVRVHNDAVCLAVAEHWKGAGRGSPGMLGMVVSTGVGGGLILGGRLIHGGSGNAGHIGHVVVEPGGPLCGCGARGCLEAVARGPGLAAWAVGQGWIPGAAAGQSRSLETAVGQDRNPNTAAEPGRGPGTASPPSAARDSADHMDHGVHADHMDHVDSVAPADPADYVETAAASGRRLALDAGAGDEIALAAMNRAGRALGLAIASAVNLCDLDVVTIGGGLSQAGHLLFGPLETTFRDHTRMEFARRTRILPAALGQDAGLIGAAALILAATHYWPH
ncbi:ROK family protein [Streptosporangium sp. NPDC051022]|uniref:ROK family protein n=1 Tax=Streptosporangium sp. NPDC051022 TaxID=3155752 RepID=UPI0034284396